MTEAVSFWESWETWREAMIVLVISAGALSYLGVWVSLKRVVYVPLALSQVSSAGVMCAFFLQEFFTINTEEGSIASALLNPSWIALLFAVLVSFYFAFPHGDSIIATVIAYLLASAVVLIAGNFVRQDLHDIQSILFGNAVLVETVQIFYISLSALIVASVHFLFYRRFLFVSFDPDSAGAENFSVFRTQALLYMTFAVMISVATRAVGSLPVFGIMIFPALAALRIASSMRASILISCAIGIFSAAFGYYLSFIWELPTGATIVSLAGVIYLITLIKRPAVKAAHSK